MKTPPFGETPQQRATYIKWAFNDNMTQCLKHVDSMLEKNIDNDFYEKVKCELKK